MPQTPPWLKYRKQDSGPWNRYSTEQPAAEPNAGLAPPAGNPYLFGPESGPQQQMKESLIPSLFRATSGTLPVVGGIGGGVAGASAGGLGAVAGGALGAAGGRSGQLAIDRTVFGNEETSPISKEGLASTGMAGLFGAAGELPAGLAIGMGNRAISRLAAARAAGQTGDVAGGIRGLAPFAASEGGLANSVSKAAIKDNAALGAALSRGSGNTIGINAVTAQAKREAIDAVTNSGGILKAVPKQLNIAIEAAKQRAGIVGNEATPQQLFDFMQELRAFKGDAGKSAGVVQDLAKMIYRDSGAHLRATVPEAAPILDRLTSYHAINSAMKGYKVGTTGAIGITAATHPLTTALLSPVAAAAAPMAISKSRKVVGNLASQFLK